jgi:hypothetical protein
MSVWQTNRFWVVSLDHNFFNFFLKTLCEHAPYNKLSGSTNFIFFGPTNQKLWVSENFRSLDKAGMC